jgi:hypothetical protein
MLRRTLNLAKASAGFKLPPSVEEAWYPLANRGGSRSDLKRVLDFLGQLWAFDQFDPRAFDEWLVSQGLRKTDLSPEKVVEYKTAFDRYQETKLEQTRNLVEGLALGPHSPEIFASLRGFSRELKRLAYRTAISVSRDEKVVFVLSALSQESPELARECVSDLPASPVLQTFFAYLKGARLPLALEQRPCVAAHSNKEPIHRLFQLATLPLKNLQEELRHMPGSEIESLARLAESLLRRVSGRAFGEFVKVNLSVFICIADPKSKSSDFAKQTIVSTGEPAVAEILALMGKDYLLVELRDAHSAKQPGRTRFLAAVIDACRRYYAESIPDLQEDLKLFSRSRVPLFAVAARAALVQLGLEKESKFEKLLLRKLQTDKKQFVIEWLLRNPEFVRYLRVERVPFKTWKVILEICKASRPALALKIAERMLQEPLGPERHRYWEDALGVLASIGGNEADSIFSDFVIRRIEEGWNLHVHDVLAKESSHSLLRRNFWKLLERTPAEQSWVVLFDAYRARTSESELVSLLEAAAQRGGSLSTWIMRQLLPSLLEEESLSLSFYGSVANRDFLVAVAKQLSQCTLENARYLRGFANEWASARDAIKRRLLSSIQGGLRIALDNCASDSGLQLQLVKLSQTIDEWAAGNSPKLEATIEALASGQLPSEYAPAKDHVEQFFRGQPRGRHDFALLAGTNPWAIDIVFGGEQGLWPKPELLVDQIVRSYVFVANLRRRAEAELKGLERTIKVELAVALREGLSDIEADLTGYFIFRDILNEIGLHPIISKLGERVDERELSSQKHKLIRDPNRKGLLRAFSLGIRVDDTIVGSATVMKSGDEDDRD